MERIKQLQMIEQTAQPVAAARSRAVPSERYAIPGDQRCFYDAYFAEAQWCVAEAMAGRREMPSPRPLTIPEIIRLRHPAQDAVRRKLFRLLFGQAPERVKPRHIELWEERLGKMSERALNRVAKQFSRLFGISPWGAVRLRKAMWEACKIEFDSRQEKAVIPVTVFSRRGYQFPDNTWLDRAEYLVSWRFAEWRGQHLHLRFVTRLDVCEVFRHVRIRDRRRCAWCGCRGETVDHLIPRSKGGRDVVNNGVASCAACNNRRGNTGLKSWIKTLPTEPTHQLVRMLLRRPRRHLIPGGYKHCVKMPLLIPTMDTPAY